MLIPLSKAKLFYGVLMFMKLSNINVLRRLIIPLLKRFDRDIEMKHPWLDGKRISLSLFKHKGYWYHGTSREKETMLLFKEVIRQNSIVVEVGGHIGFISLWFEYLTSPDGKVYVFEPGINNLPYIRKNVGSSGRITLIEKAVGSSVGMIDFYEDSLTGQNNSVVKDFEGYKQNAELSYVSSDINKTTVQITTLDTELKGTNIDFIKIDIEGGEFGAISGATEILADSQPALMVEIQANEKELYQLFLKYNYELFDPSGGRLTSPEELEGNVFCFNKNKHKDIIRGIISNREGINEQ